MLEFFVTLDTGFQSVVSLVILQAVVSGSSCKSGPQLPPDLNGFSSVLFLSLLDDNHVFEVFNQYYHKKQRTRKERAPVQQWV